MWGLFFCWVFWNFFLDGGHRRVGCWGGGGGGGEGVASLAWIVVSTGLEDLCSYSDNEWDFLFAIVVFSPVLLPLSFCSVGMAGLIPQSLQLQAQVTLASLDWSQNWRQCAKSCARRSVYFCSQSCVGDSHAPHNDVSVNDGPHIRRWSHKIKIL